MTETHAIDPAMPSGRLSRFTAFLFGGVVYLTLLFTILYAIGFVSGLVVPKTVDTGAESGSFEAIVVNLILMSLFAIQHSAMARKSFKHWRAPFIPGSADRGTHVLCASIALLLIFWQWRPMPALIWHIQEPEMAMLVATLSFVAWVVVLMGAFLIDPSELFDLQQAADNRAGRRMPIYPAIVIAFWATPAMSVGHLLLAAAATAHVFISVLLEERDPIGASGDA